MKTIAPDYYNSFACSAGKCGHSCCEGWEIDIDPETLAKYVFMDGPLGEKIRANIAIVGEGGSEDPVNIVPEALAPGMPRQEELPSAHFVNDASGRCPFLRDDGLCEIYVQEGPSALCQICRDHPRFRNFWSGRTELGLGLACEEAARLILSRKEKVQLIELEDDGEPAAMSAEEEDLFALREDLFAILQDRSAPVDDRVRKFAQFCGIDAPAAFSAGPLDEAACEQLAVYLLYRHLPDALYDGRLSDRLAFVAGSYARVRNEWAESGSTDIEVLAEIARKFSAEVEYDTDTWGDPCR